MPRSTNSLSNLHECFGTNGWLSRSHPRYEFRPGQLHMALEVERAFIEQRHLLVEAGTGTGKTLAYLIPAITSQKRVVISTGTKNLQDQLFRDDIPFLAKLLDRPLRVCTIKGRSNYLCRQKVYDMDNRPVLRGLEEVEDFSKIRQWEMETVTGDRNELEFLPDGSQLWPKVDARRETCTGQKCAQFDRCFLTEMHRQALESDIIIVNHHLFFADLALRDREYGAILPSYNSVIFDEAHEIEDIAGNYFGLTVSSYRIDDLIRDAEYILRLQGLASRELLRCLKSLQNQSKLFFSLFPSEEGRFGFDQRDLFLEENYDLYCSFQNALLRLDSELKTMSAKPEDVYALLRRLSELRFDLTFLLESRDRSFVFWHERRSRGVFLQATPIDVARVLSERLFDCVDTVVLTSATLAVGGNFDFIKSRLGVRRVSEQVLDHPFDYSEQALLYIPSQLPEPGQDNFPDLAAQEIIGLLKLTQGRAFVLFTSLSQMRQIFERVKGEVRYPLLLQGTAPNRVLLEKFKSQKGAVLFATGSFWQGVDVPGAQLSCVIVDRLPFAVPSDPVVRARIENIRDAGGNPFYEFQVPEAVIALKQGFGRLIRSRTDRGVLAILDVRIATRSYGRIFMDSLPPYRVTRRLEDVEWFLQEGGSD